LAEDGKSIRLLKVVAWKFIAPLYTQSSGFGLLFYWLWLCISYKKQERHFRVALLKGYQT
jgi:hypothetical protein